MRTELWPRSFPTSLFTELLGPTFAGKRPAPIPAPHTMFEIVGRTIITGVGYATDVELEFEPGAEHLKRLPVR